ncbi:MAG: glycosyltransferase family 2 protein [Candidatus Omnitrophota bacterium]
MGKAGRLSAIIITKNEEKNIEECLKSVEWADEVVIVDDFSGDKTGEICKNHPKVKFYENKMTGFGQQKNYALDKADGEWVLSVDADERVTPELKDEISEKIRQGDYNGYGLKRNNLIFGKWVMDSEPRNIRLFKKEKGKFTSKKVHESVLLDGSVGILENPLLHFASSCGDLTGYIGVYVNQYSAYTADDLYDMGRRVTRRNWLLYLVARPCAIFFKRYFLGKAYRQGMHGFFMCVLTAFTYFVSYAKLWEKEHEDTLHSK